MSVCYLCWLLKAALPSCKHNIWGKRNSSSRLGIPSHYGNVLQFQQFGVLAKFTHIVVWFCFPYLISFVHGTFKSIFVHGMGTWERYYNSVVIFRQTVVVWCVEKIFLDYYAFSLWSFQKWSFAIKDKIGDNDFELACFSYTHTHSHTVT